MFKRIASFTSALVLSLSSMFVFAPVMVHAAVDTCTWTGATNNNFNTASNWNCSVDGAAVPGNGDSLVFDNTGASSTITVNNDIGSASFASITFQGNGFQDFTLSGSAFTITGGMTSTVASSVIIEPDVTITGTQSISVAEVDYIITFSGVVSGSGNITKSGVGGLVLSSANTFTGSLTISNGRLVARDKDSLGSTASGTVVGNGGGLFIALPVAQKTATIAEPLTLNGATFTDTNNSEGILLSRSACGTFGASICEGTNITYSGTITLGANAKISTWGSTMTITGVLSGAYTIQLLGGDTGTLVINSSNNTSQTTNGTKSVPAETITIAEGDSQTSVSVSIGLNQTYIINGTRGTTTVNNGGVLKGSGTVGNTIVNSGGKLAPGESPGCLNSGNLTFNEGSIYEFEVGGTTECTEYDQTKVTGTVTLGNGTLSTVRYNNFNPVKDQKYTIISNDVADAVTGTFKDLAEGATFTVDGYVLKISYVGGDGNDVVLTVQSVPAVPDTGFKLLQNNPILTLVTTSALAGAMMLIAKKYGRSLYR